MPDACAIVGMACVFPGAPDLKSFWRNLRDGVDSVGDAPPQRLAPEFFDPTTRSADWLRCRKGGFIDAHASFDPIAHRIMPNAARAAEPDQLLALDLATRALADAGCAHDLSHAKRTGVVIGRGNYAGTARQRFEEHCRGAEQLIVALRDLVPSITPDSLDKVRREFQRRVQAPSGAEVIGLVPNLTASRIAERLDLAGPAYTVDAACASALVALDHACQELLTDRADLMICGAVHVCQTEAFWSVFSQLGALSANEMIRPFDERADGILIGEGAGMLVLKRLSDALRHGDRTYAVVRGVGCSSDGRDATLMSPSTRGQLLALERAWQASTLAPDDIGLVEAHGTGTPKGDQVEIEALRSFFGERGRRAGIGSAKSNIGHAMPAAGAAGLIKAALSVYNGLKPPTLHCEHPRAEFEDTRFAPLQEVQRWDSDHRVAAVSAFGFGGINAHAVIESTEPRAQPKRRVHPRPRRPSVLFALAESADQLLDALDDVPNTRDGAHRLAIIDPSPDRIDLARRLVRRGARTSRYGIFYSPQGLVSNGGKIAFLFPGFDTNFEPRIDDLVETLGVPAPPLGRGSLEEQGAAVTAVNRIVSRALDRIGVRPDFAAGHSIGEWSAMIAAGMVRPDELDSFLQTLKPDSLPFSDAVFAVAGCTVATAERVIATIPDVEISHDNCPHQVILCGMPDGIEAATAALKSHNVLVGRLPFGSGVHSRFFAPYLSPHIANISRFAYFPAHIPLYSATTCQPYPSRPELIRALITSHMVQRVRFRELVQRLYSDGARVFVQVGAGSLTAFVDDILRQSPYLAMSATDRQRSGLDQLLHTACALWAEGAEPNFDGLDLSVDQPPTLPACAPSALKLQLGFPLVRLDAVSAETGQPAPQPEIEHHADAAVVRAYTASTERMAGARRSVMTAWTQRERAVTASALKLRVSLEDFPELLDHAFFEQPPNWPVVADLAPLVPMTGLLDLMQRMLQTRHGRTVYGFEQVWAKRWLIAADPVELEVRLQWHDVRRLKIELGDYAEALVVVDPAPRAPLSIPQLEDERPAAIDAAQLYAERWMFHGPAYRGISELGPVARDGIRGILRCSNALGALLDNAGQLLGYWMLARSRPAIAMPIRIKRLTFHAPAPEPGAQVSCTVKIRELGEDRVQCDIELRTKSGPYASVEGWEDRCFSIDEAFDAIVKRPASQLLSHCPVDGLAELEDRTRNLLAQRYLEGRYLGERERGVLARMPALERGAWLSRAIAIKDAVRSKRWTRARSPLYPAEIELNDDLSKCIFSGRESDSALHVASAAYRGKYYAVASTTPAALSIVEVVATDRPLESTDASLVERESDPVEWRARLEAARSAAGVLQPHLRRALVSDRRDESFLIGGTWVRTLRRADLAIAWIAS